MHMIWHHAPGKQLITLEVKMVQGIFRDFGILSIAQMTFAMATVEVFLQFGALLPIILDSKQVLPLTAT
jgi:hypothetical protein